MKKKLITLITPVAAFIGRNKGETTLFITLSAVTLLAAIAAGALGATAPSAALAGACTGRIADTAVSALLGRFGLTFSATGRPAALAIALATLLALAAL